jgi:uncharacterized phage protein gp47/JayE
MPAPNTYSFSQLVGQWTAAAQAKASALLDFTVGSTLLALAEACAGVALWLQALVLNLLAVTRAATSQGTDLDSWMADFGLTRLPAVKSVGALTAARLNSSTRAVVPIGFQAGTTDGTQTVTVTLDTSNPHYSAPDNGYVLPISTASISVPAQNTTGGAVGNVQANTVTVMLSSISGVDTINNPAAFTGGLDAESAPAFRVRFVLYLQSLNTANVAAVEYAITSVQQEIRYVIVEDLTYPALVARANYFFVVIDDGSGHPSQGLIDAVTAAITIIRGCGVQFGVFGPTVVTANLAMTIKVASGYDATTVQTNVETALSSYTQALQLGSTQLAITRLISAANAVAGCEYVVDNTTTINGVNSDLALTTFNRVLPGTITVTPT